MVVVVFVDETVSLDLFLFFSNALTELGGLQYSKRLGVVHFTHHMNLETRHPEPLGLLFRHQSADSLRRHYRLPIKYFLV